MISLAYGSHNAFTVLSSNNTTLKPSVESACLITYNFMSRGLPAATRRWLLQGPFAQQGQGAMPMVTDTPAAFDSGRGFAHSHLAATPTSVSLTTSTWRQVAAIPEDVETPVLVVGSQSSSARGVSQVDSARGGGVARTDSTRGGVHTDRPRAPASPLSPSRVGPRVV